MKIAVPVADGRLCPHFGHCQEFELITVNAEKMEILNRETVPPPPHQPGILPQWLHQLGCDLVIAGGIGHRAVELFGQFGIVVITGVAPASPEDVIAAYLAGRLSAGDNTCDRSDHADHIDNCRNHSEG
jgi:ATP-binding protein involved in chromosome partitioning